MQNRYDNQAKEWKKYFPTMMHRLSVLPDTDHVDLDEMPVQRNFMLLQELVHRSERGLSLTEGIREFLMDATRYLTGGRSYLLPQRKGGIGVRS
jgi:hypothetical protein